MRKTIDLTGKKFGRLTVIKRAEDTISDKGVRTKRWECICDCGNKTIVRQAGLQRGTTKSCGCLHREIIGNMSRKHGLSNNCGRLYPLWKSIKYRCYCKTCKSYKNYGGRGIVMCDEWKNNFTLFYKWAIENGYKEEKTSNGINILTIDRIDVNGNYEPDNCRFITNAEQAQNKRNSIPKENKYLICPVCGKQFELKQRKGQKTCSPRCGKILYYKDHPTIKDYTKICPICNKPFNAKRGGHFNDAVYCSKRCKNLSESAIWEYNGEKHRVLEWAEIIGINAHCLYHRKELGWSIEEILTTPLRGRRNAKSKL
nr:MAG TPA: PVL ORF-50-like family [Bacteriophage sp.]DAV70115.1 MAG TPA: PVL ORF-50-like family [Caudoviricetes sp.]